jgi:hypothetical protein
VRDYHRCTAEGAVWGSRSSPRGRLRASRPFRGSRRQSDDQRGASGPAQPPHRAQHHRNGYGRPPHAPLVALRRGHLDRNRLAGAQAYAGCSWICCRPTRLRTATPRPRQERQSTSPELTQPTPLRQRYRRSPVARALDSS